MPPEQNGLSHVSLSHFQDALRRSIGAEAYEQWFAGQVRFSAQAHALTVRVANPYKQAWLQRKFQKQVRDAAAHCALTTLRWEAGDLDAVTGEGIESLIATAGDVARVAPFEVTTEPPRTGATGHTSRAAKTPTRDASLPSQQGQIELAGDTDARSRPAPSVARSTKPPVRGGKTGRGGRPARSFRSFHPGKGNALALTAAQRVCDNPFTTTMLYLHSGVGNGKSHLLEAIEHSLVRKHPELKVLRLAAETFANAFTQALDARSLPSFRQKFRNVDVLLVDDVDFFDGKKSIQEEFLHTLKRLDDAGKLVVLTADRHPRLLSKSSEEFISRCQSGMVCGIDAPSIETRRAAAFSAAQRAELEVRDDALEFVATRFADNVREIEGAIQSLATWWLMTGQRITLSVAQQVLAKLHRDCVKVVRLSEVEEAVGDVFGVTPDDLRSATKTRTYTQPRMLAMYLARRLTQAAYSEIGKHFGGRNHSTVLSAERRVHDLVTQASTIRVGGDDWSVSELVDALERRIRAG